MRTARHLHLICVQRIGLLAIVLTLILPGRSPSAAIKVEPPASDGVVYESKQRPDMLDQNSPRGLRVVQISTDPSLISHHMYPEVHMFTPDSKRFVFHRMPAAKGGGGSYWLCDIPDNFGMRKIIDERGAGVPSVTPDGRWAYYCLFDRAKRTLQLKRVSLKTFQRETLANIAAAIPGCEYELDSAGSLTSMSSDGKRLCTIASLRTGTQENVRYGVLVLDLEKLCARMAFVGDHEYCNMHLQYCRSPDSVLSHDILIQHNHGVQRDSQGRIVRLTSGAGADLHVIRDDGTHWRDVPLGRDGTAFNTGHQQWRGEMPSVVSSVSVTGGVNRHRLYEATPVPTDDTTSHQGSTIPGAKLNDLTRTAPETNFSHFCMDASGMRLAARHDQCRDNPDVKVYIATFSPGDNAFLKVQYLLNTRWRDVVKGWAGGQSNKPRPIISPDGSVVLFHTDRDGNSEIFLVDHYTLP